MTEIEIQTEKIEDKIARPPTPNNSWTPRKEETSLRWQRDFKMKKDLHKQVESYYSRLNQILSIPSILITAITSVGIFATLGIEDKTPIIILAGILNIIALFLQGVNEFYDPKTLSHSHENTAKQYFNLYLTIDEQLTQDYFDRDNGRDFIKAIRAQSTDIVMNGPAIPKRFWDKYFQSVEKGEAVNPISETFLAREDDEPNKLSESNVDSHPQNLLQNSPDETIIPMSVMDEEEPIAIERSFSEVSQNSKETLNQMKRYINTKKSKGRLARQLAHHIGRI